MKKLIKFIFSKLIGNDIKAKNNSKDDKTPWNYYNQLISM